MLLKLISFDNKTTSFSKAQIATLPSFDNKNRKTSQDENLFGLPFLQFLLLESEVYPQKCVTTSNFMKIIGDSLSTYLHQKIVWNIF